MIYSRIALIAWTWSQKKILLVLIIPANQRSSFWCFFKCKTGPWIQDERFMNIGDLSRSHLLLSGFFWDTPILMQWEVCYSLWFLGLSLSLKLAMSSTTGGHGCFHQSSQFCTRVTCQHELRSRGSAFVLEHIIVNHKSAFYSIFLTKLPPAVSS